MIRSILLVFCAVFLVLSNSAVTAEEVNRTIIESNGEIIIEGEIVDLPADEVERIKASEKEKTNKSRCSSWCSINTPGYKGCYTAFGMCVPVGSPCSCKVQNRVVNGPCR